MRAETLVLPVIPPPLDEVHEDAPSMLRYEPDDAVPACRIEVAFGSITRVLMVEFAGKPEFEAVQDTPLFMLLKIPALVPPAYKVRDVTVLFASRMTHFISVPDNPVFDGENDSPSLVD